MGQIKNIKLYIVTDIKLYQHITQKKHSKMANEAIPAVPESISKRAKNLERVKAARAVAVVKRRKALKEKRGVVYKRAAKYAKEYRAKERDEIRLRSKARFCDPYPWYQPGVAESEESTAVASIASNQQWGFRQTEQVFVEHVAIGGAVRGMGLPQPENDSRPCVQTWFRQSEPSAYPDLEQRSDRRSPRGMRYHLR